MKHILVISIFISLTSCYPKIKIDGFDQNRWNQQLTCENSRLSLGQILIDNQHELLGQGQAEIKSLLGQPNEHELYNRNQKFFFYNLTAPDTCANIEIAYRLSVKFDAIDRAKEILIEQ